MPGDRAHLGVPGPVGSPRRYGAARADAKALACGADHDCFDRALHVGSDPAGRRCTRRGGHRLHRACRVLGSGAGGRFPAFVRRAKVDCNMMVMRSLVFANEFIDRIHGANPGVPIPPNTQLPFRHQGRSWVLVGTSDPPGVKSVQVVGA